MRGNLWNLDTFLFEFSKRTSILGHPKIEYRISNMGPRHYLIFLIASPPYFFGQQTWSQGTLALCCFSSLIDHMKAMRELFTFLMTLLERMKIGAPVDSDP